MSVEYEACVGIGWMLTNEERDELVESGFDEDDFVLLDSWTPHGYFLGEYSSVGEGSYPIELQPASMIATQEFIEKKYTEKMDESIRKWFPEASYWAFMRVC